MRRALIPNRYKNVKKEDIPEQVLKAYNKLVCLANNKTVLFMHGNVGCGKTHTAWSLYLHSYNELERIRQLNLEQYKEKNGNELECKFLTLPIVCKPVKSMTEIFSELRSEFDKKKDEKSDVIENLLKGNDIIILDDIGSEKSTEWTQEKYYEIIDRCYNKCARMIITSNYSLGELVNIIGIRSADRLKEMSYSFDLSTTDSKRK